VATESSARASIDRIALLVCEWQGYTDHECAEALHVSVAQIWEARVAREARYAQSADPALAEAVDHSAMHQRLYGREYRLLTTAGLAGSRGRLQSLQAAEKAAERTVMLRRKLMEVEKQRHRGMHEDHEPTIG